MRWGQIPQVERSWSLRDEPLAAICSGLAKGLCGSRDAVDGSCSIGDAMRQIAVVMNCEESSYPIQVTTIGLDLAKNVFHVHGVMKDGSVAFSRSLRRSQMFGFSERLEPCLIGMEACGTSHYWARELAKLGHEVRLIAPVYVKHYVKRGKSDAADAEAICEPVTRPTVRFVEVKSPEQQAILSLHRARNLVVRQTRHSGHGEQDSADYLGSPGAQRAIQDQGRLTPKGKRN